MTDFHQRQATSTLTAPAARGLTPHSLLSLAVIKRPARLREIIIQLKIKTVMWMLQHKEHHHNHSESNILTIQQVSRLAPPAENVLPSQDCSQ